MSRRAGARIVVVGAGVAGSVAAYRLRKLLGSDAQIEVLEASERVGGRARTVELGGVRLEVGASVLHPRGRRLAALAAGLEVATVPARGRGGGTGIWDGSRFRLAARSGRFEAELVRRLGGAELARLSQLVSDTVDAWGRVYDPALERQAIESPGELLDAVGIESLPAIPLRARLAAAGIGSGVIDGLVTPLLRNIYAQGAEINALAGLVGLAGAGIAGGELFAMRDGNAALFGAALRAAGARLHLESPVRAIHPDGDGALVLTEDGAERRADAVVIAAPPELAGIELPGADWQERPYRRVHVTLVAGVDAPDYFRARSVPATILTADVPGVGFHYSGVVGRTPGGTPIRKLFSETALSDAELAGMFSAVREVWRGRWRAYPVLAPVAEAPAFRLAPRVYAVSAMESVVSTMEHQAVAAAHVAELVRRDLRARPRRTVTWAVPWDHGRAVTAPFLASRA